MGWIQRLFGERDDARTIALQSGESRADQAVCVNLDGAHIIDLRPLPLDTKRILGAIAQLATQVQRSPQRIQVWVMSTPQLEAFRDGSVDDIGKLTNALFVAGKHAQRKMIVEKDAPKGMVYILGSLGFEVFLPGLCLTASDGSEIDVLKQLETLRRAPHLRV